MAKRINIPNVTGNVVITARTSAINSGGSDPVSGDVLSYMTFGKGINQTTTEMTDNPKCWATINPVTVTNGTTYTISVNGTYLWVLAIDDSGNPVVPFLTTGTNSNPQSFTFTATTSKIKFGCYDPDHVVTYCTLTESSSSGGSGGSGGNPGSGTSYTITRNLTNCTSSNTSSSVNQGSSYSATITPNSGYTLSSITVTMNGTDITDTAVNIKTDTSNTNVSGETLSVSGETLSVSGETLSVSGETLSISGETLSVSGTYSNTTRYAVVNISNVTGNIVISATAVEEAGGGEEETTYTITRNLSNCTSSNTSSSVDRGASYSTTITPNSGYELLNVAITMGGTDVTSSVYTYQNGNAVINIPSVTGNVVITVQASSSSSGGTDPTPDTPSTSGDLTGTYLFFGDSICRGGGANNYGYPEAVKAKQPSMTALNYSVSGTCIAKNDSYDVNYPSILSKIQGSTPYADYVVLEGGFNDSWGQRNPLGTLKGGSAPTTADAIRSYSASLNAYQYTDALEKCICEIKLKYWDKKIFFVIPHTVDAAVYANTYHSRAVEVCNKWGVIVIDLRNCGMPSYQDGTYNVDGTHPSAAGYDKYFAPNIINVLKANK